MLLQRGLTNMSVVGPSAEEGKLHGKLLLVTQSSIDRYVRSIDASQWAMGWLMRDATITPGRADRTPGRSPLAARCACVVSCRSVAPCSKCASCTCPSSSFDRFGCSNRMYWGQHLLHAAPRLHCDRKPMQAHVSLMWRTRSPRVNVSLVEVIEQVAVGCSLRIEHRVQCIIQRRLGVGVGLVLAIYSTTAALRPELLPLAPLTVACSELLFLVGM